MEIDLRNLSLDYQRWIEMHDEGKLISSYNDLYARDFQLLSMLLLRAS